MTAVTAMATASAAQIHSLPLVHQLPEKPASDAGDEPDEQPDARRR